MFKILLSFLASLGLILPSSFHNIPTATQLVDLLSATYNLPHHLKNCAD